jgi:hypothetical protein
MKPRTDSDFNAGNGRRRTRPTARLKRRRGMSIKAPVDAQPTDSFVAVATSVLRPPEYSPLNEF